MEDEAVKSGEPRAQRVKDYKLAVEYKWLKKQAPGGVYVLPSPTDLRTWHGVIFIRRGMYSNGIFKFRMELPPEYNDVNVVPRIFFVTPVFNPLVNPQTGELDIRSYFPEWSPEKHYVITVLTFLKKIFYMKEFGSAAPGTTPWNPQAQHLYENDRAEFLSHVEQCVHLSQENVYRVDDGSLIRFREHKPVHDRLLDALTHAHQAVNSTDHTQDLGSRRMRVLDIMRGLKMAEEDDRLEVPEEEGPLPP